MKALFNHQRIFFKAASSTLLPFDCSEIILKWQHLNPQHFKPTLFNPVLRYGFGPVIFSAFFMTCFFLSNPLHRKLALICLNFRAANKYAVKNYTSNVITPINDVMFHFLAFIRYRALWLSEAAPIQYSSLR